MKIPRVKIYLKFRIFLKSIFSSLEISKKELSDYLKIKLNKSYINFFGMCRTCFIVILEFLKEKNLKKNEILICAYNLEEMVEIAKLLKFETKFIDINANSGVIDFNLIKNNISEKTSAILFTNMFNRYEDLIELKNFCKNQDILLIEDLAIYFGNFSLVENKKIYAGSIADVSILSFGIMKNVSAIYGGAMLTSNLEIYNFASNLEKNYKNFPIYLYVKKFFLFIILKIFLSKLIYNFFFFYVIKIAKLKEIKKLLNIIYPAFAFKVKSDIPIEYFSKIPNLSIKIINNIIKDNDFEIDKEKRKINNLYYSKLLKNNLNVKIINIIDPDFQNFLDYPILIKNKKELVNYLMIKGLETRYHFYSNCEKNYNLNDCKNSELFEKELICLPSHSDITKDKIEYYCREINKFYEG